SNYDPSLCAGCSNQSLSAGVTDQALSDLVSGRHRLRSAVGRAGVDIARQSRSDVERTLEFAVKQQLLGAELSKQSLAYAREAQMLGGHTFDLEEKRYGAGAISEADLARADVQRLEADQAVDVAMQTLALAKAQLAFLLGLRDLAPDQFDVSDDLTRPSFSPRLDHVTAAEIREEAMRHRPDLAAAQIQVQRARLSIDLARRLRFPDFSPSLQYSREGTGQSAIQPPTVTFGVGAPLPIFYRYRGEVARAEADLQQQEIVLQKVEGQIAADVNGAFAAFTSSRDRVERLRTRLIPQAALAPDLVRLQHEKGAASLFEFLDAQRSFLGVQNESLQALSDCWTAVFQLEQADGTEIHE